jgi:AcrR family transcriptional regulator
MPVTARRVGRPRSDDRDRAILDAALALLVEDGFAGMSIEGIAARAGVGKTTVYRRWKNKAEVVVEALRGHVCHDMPLPDTGDVRRDLVSMYEAMQQSLNGADGTIMTAFTAEKFRHPELRDEFDRTFVAVRRAHMRRLVQQGIATGELAPNTDVELVADVGPALLWHRFTMKHGRIDRDLPKRIIDQFLPRCDAPRHSPPSQMATSVPRRR